MVLGQRPHNKPQKLLPFERNDNRKSFSPWFSTDNLKKTVYSQNIRQSRKGTYPLLTLSFIIYPKPPVVQIFTLPFFRIEFRIFPPSNSSFSKKLKKIKKNTCNPDTVVV